jgi:5-methyltetrahydropteroyltriglutamate--homocysteine methyltransferase
MRQGVREGRVSEAELHAPEDRAVREAIAFQEAAGLEVITGGEFRRYGWIATIPICEDSSYYAPLSGYDFLPADSGWSGL